ncbi:MAG: restriction endonuclease subunit S [Brevundimonas sp.]
MSLPSGWAKVRFGDLTPPDAPIIYGILQPGPDAPLGVPYVRPSEISNGQIRLNELRRTTPKIAESYARSTLAVDDLILSIVGTIGKVASVPRSLEGGNITQSSCRIRPDQSIVSNRYLQHFLGAPGAVYQYNAKRLGTAVPRLNLADVREFILPLPPLAEQRLIAAKLDALTTRLARARREADSAVKLHGEFALSLLRSAVTGALTESWRASNPYQEKAEELLARVAAPVQGRGGREATEKVIQGVAGLSVNNPGTLLPAGWVWAPLLRVAKQETGHTPSRSKPSYWDGGVPWIGIRDAGAHHGRTIYDTAQTITEEGLANSSARLLPKGTVCLSRTASVGYVTMMGRTMATSQDFATWTCTEALLPEYLMYVLMAEGDDIRRFGMGSTHTTIYFPEIRAFHIGLPPIEEQREIVNRVQAALTRADRLEAEAKKAFALIDRLEAAILAKAFRGELVAQDPNDEPASVLLERIRARRAAEPKAKRGRRPKLTESVGA